MSVLIFHLPHLLLIINKTKLQLRDYFVYFFNFIIGMDWIRPFLYSKKSCPGKYCVDIDSALIHIIRNAHFYFPRTEYDQQKISSIWYSTNIYVFSNPARCVESYCETNEKLKHWECIHTDLSPTTNAEPRYSTRRALKWVDGGVPKPKSAYRFSLLKFP